MKVKAISLGYYGDKRRYPGQVFDVAEKDFSKNWMTKDIEEKAEKAAKPAKTHDKDKAVI